MKISDVSAQLETVMGRAIEAGISVAQFRPTLSRSKNFHSIGDLKATSIALRDVPYADMYTELDKNNQYHIKLPDGGLLIFQYSFKTDVSAALAKHRLAFFPCPKLPTMEEAPELYKKDELYGDIVMRKIVRFPVRFDYDPINYKPRHHPHSHLTFGHFENCRIPVNRPVSPHSFLLFILRNFYFLLYKKKMNVLEKKVPRGSFDTCITDHEREISYLSI